MCQKFILQVGQLQTSRTELNFFFTNHFLGYFKARNIQVYIEINFKYYNI